MENESFLASECEIGTHKMVEELEKAFLESCVHNKTTPEDMKYFRRYSWNLISILVLRIEELEDKKK